MACSRFCERPVSEKQKGEEEERKIGEMIEADILDPAFVLTWAGGPACTHAL